MKLIGGYQVIGLLGRGGMGAVYRVRAPGGGPVLALKLLDPRPQLVASWGAEPIARRFRAEMDILAGLGHPHLVAVRGQGRHEGRPFYLMDHFCWHLGREIGEAPDLEKPTRVLDPDRVLAWGRQALAGLAALHAAGVVHRDLKPDNLMLDAGERLLIGDLGLGLVLDHPWRPPAGLRVGSPGYAAPEQARDPGRAHPGADLYGLGATLYRLLTGRLPGADPASVSSLNSLLDPAWDAFLARSLAPGPDDRFGGAGEMAVAWAELAQAWAARRPAVCAQPAAPAPPATWAPRSRPAKIAPRRARETLGLDALWRPGGYWPAEFRAADDAVVEHPGSGLAWRPAGGGRVDWLGAGLAVAALNRQAAGGRRDWRLPTAGELAVLAGPPGAGDFCGAGPLAGRAWRLWSADRASFRSAWVFSARGGFFAALDFTCRAEVWTVAGPAASRGLPSAPRLAK